MNSHDLKPENSDPHIPLILIFSKRERIRDILTVGLLQCQYRVTQAANSDVASLKASQFMPDLVLADITEDNTKDILMANRLKHSERTKNIAMLVIVPQAMKEKLEKILYKKTDSASIEKTQLDVIEYPFSFSDLLNKIQTILKIHEKIVSKDWQSEKDEYPNRSIGERLFDSNIDVEKKLREIASLLQKQWAFPYTVIKALDIIGSESSCCNELSKCIKTDLSASAAILKVANTVEYAKRHNRITDIKVAVVRLGFKQTRNLLSCFALIDLSPAVYTKSGFTRREFWLHSLSTAHIAEKICADCGLRRPELAFVAGLIHDLGKIPLDNNFKNVFPKLLEETTTKIGRFYEIEKYLISFSHAELGHFLTTEWNFPSAISLGVLNHHNPQRILETSPAVDRLMHEAVFIANQISKAMNLGHSCDEILEEIPQRMLRELKFQKGPSDRFITTIIRKLNQMATYLNIPIKNLTVSMPSPESSIGEILFVHGSHAEFHPLILALRHNGYTVRVMQKMPSEPTPEIKVIISMPESGVPFDIMLFDEEYKSKKESPILKIFILDIDPQKTPLKGYTDSNIVFVNKSHLDLRLILHTLDKFFETVVIPTQEKSQNGI